MNDKEPGRGGGISDQNLVIKIQVLSDHVIVKSTVSHMFVRISYLTSSLRPSISVNICYFQSGEIFF